ncbi:MAG: hypothetical protein ACE5F5_13140 [Acidimicrobiia bacterium]
MVLGTVALGAALVLTACSDAPFQGIGERSSKWINEPTVPTTTTIVFVRPEVISSGELQWLNDSIETENLNDRDALISGVFSRRQGDRFIQASRTEISVALPGVEFPSLVPYGAEWVSSQLVIESTGRLADDPAAAFGIWSTEPYTRSRTVAQMVVLNVAVDPETATALAEGEGVSCAGFSDVSTQSCETVEIGSTIYWRLRSAGGTTFIWFDDVYRYELFGRSFVPPEVLLRMATDTVPLSSLAGDAS